MIHVISAANRHLYENTIEDHFRIRHDIFVGERGWRALAKPDRREVDSYDNENAVYLLAMEGQRIVGGHRLYPTVRPTMLGEVLPHLASVRGVPSDPTIWEWCRFFVVKDRREGQLTLQLMAAIQEFCLEEGLSELSGAMETWLLPRFQEMGFVVIPLGLPAIVDGAWTIASKVEISTDTLDHVRSLANITGSLLVRQGPQLSLVDHARTMFRQAQAS